MDNFELNTFSIESNLDWEKLFEGDAVSSSQASQQSDYLRNIDLGLDIEDFDFLQAEDSCVGGDVKLEPESPYYDVIDQLMYSGSEYPAPQQLNPDVVMPQEQQQQLFIPSSVDDQCENEEETILPDTIQDFPEALPEFPEGMYTDGCDEPIDEEEVDLDDVSKPGDSPSPGVVDSTTLDMETYTKIKTQSRNTRPTKLTQRESHPLFTDEYLRWVGTKEFNRKIQEMGISTEDTKKWKRRRRTLKNRGYAQNCRQRRIGKHQEADEENLRLRLDLAEERARSARLRQKIAELEAALVAVKTHGRAGQ